MSRRTMRLRRLSAAARHDASAALCPCAPAALNRTVPWSWRLAIVAFAWLSEGSLERVCAATTIEIQVSASSDDATDSEYSVSLASAQMRLGIADLDAYHGIRFVNVPIPAGAKVLSASIQFRAASTQQGSPSATEIYGIAESNAAGFSKTPGCVYKRALTSASTQWSMGSWKNNSWYRSPDVATIIQEIVDRPDWQAGNSLAFVFPPHPNDRRRDAAQWDAGSSSAAKLLVEFEGGVETPLVHWKLDEQSGATLYNSGLLGSAAHATAGGKYALNVSGLIVDGGTGMQFSNGYATPGNVASINTGAGLPLLKRTIEFWFQADHVNGRQVLCEQGGGLRDWVIYLDGNSLVISADNRNEDDGGGAASPWGDPPVYVIAKERILPGVRYHVAAVLDAQPDSTAGVLRGYLNGVEFGESAGAGPIWSHNQLNLGKTRESNRYHDNTVVTEGNPFYGVLDDVKIWGAVLSPPTVLENYGKGWGLLAHWKFDELSGSIAYDSSGCDNHLELLNGPLLGISGALGSGVQFAAQTAQAIASRSIGLDALGANDHDFTVTLWVKPGRLTGDWRPLFHKGAENFQRGPGIWLQPGSHRVHGRLSTSYNANEGFDSSPLPADAWSHLAIVKSANRFRCYINGKLDVDYALRGASVGNTGPVYVGDSPWYRVSECQLDDVRIYHRVIDEQEIEELAASGLTGDLAGHWVLNETAGTVAADQSPLANHATFQGSPTQGSEGPYPNTRAVNLDSADDRVVAEHAPALALGNSQFTLACWVLRRPLGATDSDLIAKRAVNGATEFAVRLTDANQVQLIVNQGQPTGGSGPWSGVGGVNLDYNRWHHVAVVYDGAAVAWYVDGQLDRLQPANFVIGNEALDLVLGGLADAPLYGALHDVRIHRRALAHDEIAELYGLVGWYRCEETAGNVVADASGAGRHGVLVGTGAWESSGREGQGCLRLESSAYVDISGVAPAGPHASLAGWAKLRPVAGHGADLLNLGGSLVLRLDEASQGWGAVALAHNGASYDPASSGRYLAEAGWRHYAAVLNAELGTLDLYVDGIRRGTVPSQGAGSFANLVSRTVLGGDALGSSDYPLSGWIDDLRVYNRPLSSRELRRLYYQREVTGPRIFEWYETR